MEEMMAAGIVPPSTPALGIEGEKPCNKSSAAAHGYDPGFSLSLGTRSCLCSGSACQDKAAILETAVPVATQLRDPGKTPEQE